MLNVPEAKETWTWDFLCDYAVLAMVVLWRLTLPNMEMKQASQIFLRKMTAFLAEDLSYLFPEMISLCFVSHGCHSASYPPLVTSWTCQCSLFPWNYNRYKQLNNTIWWSKISTTKCYFFNIVTLYKVPQS